MLSWLFAPGDEKGDALQSVVAYFEALACCTRIARGVKVISWRTREVCMLRSSSEPRRTWTFVWQPHQVLWSYSCVLFVLGRRWRRQHGWEHNHRVGGGLQEKITPVRKIKCSTK